MPNLQEAPDKGKQLKDDARQSTSGRVNRFDDETFV
jgi:hypothetical protein